VTNFQTLDIRGAAGATVTTAVAGEAYNMAKLAGITTVEVGALINNGSTGAETVIINNLAKGAGVSIKAALGDNVADNLAIVVKDAGAGSPNDTIGVTLSGATAVTTTGRADHCRHRDGQPDGLEGYRCHRSDARAVDSDCRPRNLHQRDQR